MNQRFTYAIPTHALSFPATADRICGAVFPAFTRVSARTQTSPYHHDVSAGTQTPPTPHPLFTVRLFAYSPANYTLLTANSLTYTFSAKERDPETGLSYFGSRYYSSDLSIWLSVDPMSDKYASLSPYTYCADNPIILIDFDGQDWVLVTGNAALWYGGTVGDKSNLIHTYKATSGLDNATTTTGVSINCQYAKYQNVENGGPTPEGRYYINLKPDPNRIANADPKTGQLLRSPKGGIEKIPDYYQREDGLYCTYSEWGYHRAKLEPVSVTGASNRDNNSFYMHDSEKGYTHGCIEIEKQFFNDLIEYGKDNSKIDVIIAYPGPDHNTNGGTKKTVITE